MLSEQEFKGRTSYKCSYDEYKACYCPDCVRKGDCIHQGAFRRLPEVDGGLGLCPNLISIRKGAKV